VRPPDSIAAKIGRAVTHAPVHIVLLLVGVLWLVPTIGLFLTSLMKPEVIGTTGWWHVISQPHLFAWTNYSNLFHNTSIPATLRITAEIAIGGTILPILVAASAAYAFAWVDFPGRDWLFVGVIALLVVPLQMALIPIFTLYNKAHLYDTILGLILFHTAFGLPFAIFLLRNFFIGIPQDILESARIDGASGARGFDPAAAHALGVGRASRRGSLPRTRGARGHRQRDRAIADQPLPPHGSALPRACGGGAIAKRLGEELCRAPSCAPAR